MARGKRYIKVTVMVLAFTFTSNVASMPALLAADQPRYDSNLSFSYLTTQPNVAAQPANHTTYIHSYAFDGNQLIAGYGDYTYNTDSHASSLSQRVGIVPYDLTTNTWQPITYTGSEENDVFRTINGSLYTTAVDPSVNGLGGYATNASGSWQVHNAVPEAEHVYDVATLTGSDLWLFGSTHNPPANNDDAAAEAMAWRSTDNGTTWNEVMSDSSTPIHATNGYERYYWGLSLNGKMYMQANNISPIAPLRIYDGATNTWSNGTTNSLCTNDVHALVFDNHIVCSGSDGNLTVMDEAATTTASLPSSAPHRQSLYTTDLYADNGYLYLLEANGDIYRTSSLTGMIHWSYLGTTSGASGLTASAALGVHDGYIYTSGYDSGAIYKSNVRVGQIQATPWPSAPTITSVTPATTPLDDQRHEVTLTGTNVESIIGATFVGQPVPFTVSANQVTVTLDTVGFEQRRQFGSIALESTHGDITYATVNLVPSLVAPNPQSISSGSVSLAQTTASGLARLAVATTPTHILSSATKRSTVSNTPPEVVHIPVTPLTTRSSNSNAVSTVATSITQLQSKRTTSAWAPPILAVLAVITIGTSIVRFRRR